MKNTYLYTFNSNLSPIIKIEALKNIILEELFEVFLGAIVVPVRLTPKDKAILNYSQLLFSGKQKLKYKESGIEITASQIIIDCSGNINNFDAILELKEIIKKQLYALL